MSSSSITTRELAISDHGAAVALWEQMEGIEVCEGDLEHELDAYLQRNPGLSRVALDGEKLVAAVLCGHDGRRGWIYHLAVAKEYRSRGIAKRLVDECVDGLRAARIRRAIILVASDNPTGREFWLRAGWEELDCALPMARDV
jgi:ribosomal protein S18 acetylase RimI-like enzyme